ncbi:GNAT family N-acetyltransferase [Pseudalkalibacillus sp. A8]|uniref:GNAT family N-acetyltransferase n=1 Tax=Pseudalkalibacillus sp. A8 TaxID=3382641 RepID=UPI0038B55642
MHPEYWGRGYATDASNVLLDFGFSTLSLHRIVATYDPDNSRSAKVLTKLGMSYEGRLLNHLRIKNI